jgi:hypothetical protein
MVCARCNHGKAVITAEADSAVPFQPMHIWWPIVEGAIRGAISTGFAESNSTA